jgi:hypothetical protein
LGKYKHSKYATKLTIQRGITMREQSIFYNLAAENENSTTELLCNLCKNEDSKQVVLDALGLKDLPVSFDDIQTQQSISIRKKRPDIVIENEQVKVYIENKTNRNYRLLKSQKHDYPQDLMKSKKNVKLIYLVPKGYKYIEDIEDVEEKHGFVSIVYWEDLIDALEKFNVGRNSEIIGESIIFFNKILKSIPKTNFTTEDILFMNNIENFRAEVNTMSKELELFSNVIEKLRENLGIKLLPKEPILDCSEDALGYYFLNAAVFIGYSFAMLDAEKAEEKEYALSLAIHKESIKSKIKTYEKHPYIVDDCYYYFKLDPNIFSSNEKEKLLLNYCEDILKELLKV